MKFQQTCSVSPLFDGDLSAHTNKSLLVTEIEPKLDLSLWNEETDLDTHVVVDFMSKIRQMQVSTFKNMGAAIDAIINSASCLSKKVKFVHMVLDSYIEMSLKEGERMRRTDSTIGIDIVGLNRNTPIPQQLDKFWASKENKQNLQLLVRDIVSTRTSDNATIIASSIVSDDEVLSATATGGQEIPNLFSWIEEADARLVVHVEWAVRVHKCKRIVIVSNDTDTFTLLLHYAPSLIDIGLEEMWQQYGTGEKRRMLPIHQAVSVLGSSLAKTVIKAHILTGDDCMSKVGSKHAAMSCDPVQYLTNFGETDIMLEQDAALAEKYLVHVWAGARSTTTCDTFDQLRLENYISGKCGLDALPPTSSEIRGHIKRGAYLVHKACQLLNRANEQESKLQPFEYGWEENFGALLPSKYLNPLPPNLLTVCNCAGKCNSRRCRCRFGNVKCVIFCHENTTNSSCENVPKCSKQ